MCWLMYILPSTIRNNFNTMVLYVNVIHNAGFITNIEINHSTALICLADQCIHI